VHILLVEDDEIDVRIVRDAMEKCAVVNPVTVARDGVEALEILRGENGHPPLPRPFLILLDLNMSRMNGFRFLERLREDERLKNSVVFVLTSSNAERDKVEAYEFNVAGYLLKYQAGTDFAKSIDLIRQYMRVVEFPP
jgi:CheY-like chemotaxis protein